MAKIVAIDYGTKRVGIAATDDLQIIASGLTTVHAKDLIVYLKEYESKNTIECFVIGEPKNLQNKETDSSEAINNFAIHLQRTFPSLPVHRIDERFTSKIAFQSMIDSGLSKKQRANKELVDEVSATVILQDFMTRRSNGF
ncbi:MAG: putative Holliday junction resolvase [Parvicellaceae bacterium]|jgi:putative Holliday junction resolvase